MSFSRIFDPYGINLQSRGRSYSKQVIRQRLHKRSGTCYTAEEIAKMAPVPIPTPPTPPTPSTWISPLEVRGDYTHTYDMTTTMAQTYTAVPTFDSINVFFDNIQHAYHDYTRPFDYFFLPIYVPYITFQFKLHCRPEAPETETILQLVFRSPKFGFEKVHEHSVTVHGQISNITDRVNQDAEYNFNVFILPFGGSHSVIFSNIEQTYGGNFVYRPQKISTIETGTIILNKDNYVNVDDNNALFFDRDLITELGTEIDNLQFAYNLDPRYFTVTQITVTTTIAINLCGSYRP